MSEIPRASSDTNTWFASQQPGLDIRADFGIGIGTCDNCSKTVKNRGCKQCDTCFCLECFIQHQATCAGPSVEERDELRGSSSSWFSPVLRFRAASDGINGGDPALAPKLSGVIDDRDDFGAGMSVCDMCAKPVLNRGCKRCDKCFCPEHFLEHKGMCKGPQMELKQKLKKHFEDATWFREFLSEVMKEKVTRGARTEAEHLDESIGLSARNKGYSKSFPSTEGSASSTVEQDTQVLVMNAQTKWRRMCEDVRRGEATKANLREACESLERQCEVHRTSAHVILETIDTMKAQGQEKLTLRESEVARDQILSRTTALQTELAKLNKRTEFLEAPIGSFQSTSSFASRIGASFTYRTVSTESPEERRSRTCINRESNCVVT